MKMLIVVCDFWLLNHWKTKGIGGTGSQNLQFKARKYQNYMIICSEVKGFEDKFKADFIIIRKQTMSIWHWRQ